MQASLPRLNGESFPVLLGGFIPAAALEQQVSKKPMTPGRLAIEVRTSVGETRGKIQVLVTKFEPGLAFVGVQRGELVKFFRRSAEVLLS